MQYGICAQEIGVTLVLNKGLKFDQSRTCSEGRGCDFRNWKLFSKWLKNLQVLLRLSFTITSKFERKIQKTVFLVFDFSLPEKCENFKIFRKSEEFQVLNGP